jgi:2'-5' RNA ligase
MSAGEQKLRLFVALPAPVEIRNALAETQGELRKLLPGSSASWTHPDRMHLTLRFLGDVEPARVEALTSSLSSAVEHFGPIDLVAERLGCFPDVRHPRVVWARVHDRAERLAELQGRIASATAAFTREPEEKRFTGHVTLARIRQINRSQAEVIAAFVQSAADRAFGAWTAAKIELIRSELSSAGSHYTCLTEFPL